MKKILLMKIILLIRKLLRQETQDSAFSEETPRTKVRGTISRHDHISVVVVVGGVVVVVLDATFLLPFCLYSSLRDNAPWETAPVHFLAVTRQLNR